MTTKIKPQANGVDELLESENRGKSGGLLYASKNIGPGAEERYKHFRDDPELRVFYRGIPPFHVILSDVCLPGGMFEGKFDEDPFSPILLQPYLDKTLVAGLGIFVPEHFETHYESSNGMAVTVASKECWTSQSTRDWRKLFNLVLKASAESLDFTIR